MDIRFKSIALAAALCLPFAAQAHRSWMLPSATVLSGNAPWVTVDAAVSNDLFYFEHNPMRLDNLSIVGPDGAAVKAENMGTGKYRSTFDVQLAQPGTYKLQVVNQGLTASYKLNGESKRWRGTAEAMAKEIPADAQELSITQSQSRIEVFVTAGKPNDTVLKTTGSGLELAPVTHPNDLVAGDTANFRFLLDGKPAANLKAAIIPGGIRYRDKLNEMEVVTDQDGRFSVKWPAPGLYWLNASVQDEQSGIKGAKRRAGYSATFEVLSP